MWTPDIVLYNAAGDGEQGREMRTLIQVPHVHTVPRATMPRVQVDYQGNVTLLTQAIYMSKCMVDVTYYPFDMQVQHSTVQYSKVNSTVPTTPSTCSCASSSSPPGPPR